MVVDVLFKLVIDNVELVDSEFKLLKMVVDVLFKLVIDNVELVDSEFKLLKMVVDVLFKLVIDNVELVDNEFKLLKMVVDVLFKLVILEFIVNTDKPDAFTLPTTFNVDKHVAALFNVVDPDTFNEELILVLLLFIIILLVPLTLHMKLPFPTAFKFTFPVPLVDILIDLLGSNGSNCGKNDTPYIFCCPNICP
jgi:hypothetical protein